IKSGNHFLHHLRCEGIHLFGPVQRQRHDAVVNINLDRLIIGHVILFLSFAFHGLDWSSWQLPARPQLTAARLLCTTRR
ncbi:MAG: hypothetical protein RL317_1465, partial [Pseudomonadota bacterium]